MPYSLSSPFPGISLSFSGFLYIETSDAGALCYLQNPACMLYISKMKKKLRFISFSDHAYLDHTSFFHYSLMYCSSFHILYKTFPRVLKKSDTLRETNFNYFLYIFYQSSLIGKVSFTTLSLPYSCPLIHYLMGYQHFYIKFGLCNSRLLQLFDFIGVL